MAKPSVQETFRDASVLLLRTPVDHHRAAIKTTVVADIGVLSHGRNVTTSLMDVSAQPQLILADLLRAAV
jgi:hypothetical protein